MGNPFSFDPRGNHPHQDQFQQILIAKPFDQKEINGIMEKFKKADEIFFNYSVQLMERYNTANATFPVKVHCLAQPDFTFTGIFHGLTVFHGEICVILSFFEGVNIQLFLIKHDSIIYLATTEEAREEPIIFIDNTKAEFNEACKFYEA